MNRERMREIFCVVLLAAFVAFLMHSGSVSEKSAQEIFEKASESFDLSELSECDKTKLKAETRLDKQSLDSFVYYASDSVMQVREYLIIKPADKTQLADIKTALKNRAEEKAKLFEGYAPEQSALLQSFVLTEKDGVIFFAVAENRADALAAFQRAV